MCVSQPEHTYFILYLTIYFFSACFITLLFLALFAIHSTSALSLFLAHSFFIYIYITCSAPQYSKMLPPKDVYSAVIHNQTGAEVTVHVTYTNGMENTTSQHTITVPAGGQATAEQRTFTQGSAEFTTAITAVQVEGAPAKLTAPFAQVDSPTKDYPIHIVEADGALQLQGKSA